MVRQNRHMNEGIVKGIGPFAGALPEKQTYVQRQSQPAIQLSQQITSSCRVRAANKAK